MACLFVMLYFVSVLSAAAASLESTQVPRYRYRLGLCQACAYDLAGLGEGATCPECGRPGAESAVMVMSRTRIEPVAAWRLFLVMLAGGAAAVAFCASALAIEEWSYRLQGFRPDVAAAARVVRGFDLPELTCGVIPLGSLLLASPWLARLPRGLRFGPVVLAVLGGGTALCVASLVAAVYVSYG